MSEISRIYFDYNATSPVTKKVQVQVLNALQVWGNPSSIHWAGQEAKTPLRQARQNVAKILGVSALEIIFTSGGSESNTSVLSMLCELWRTKRLETSAQNRNEVIVSAVEHPSVLRMAEELQRRGIIVHRVPVSVEGVFDFDFFERVLSEKTLLVSVMLANNETGHIFPLKKITELAHKFGALVHSDCVQALGKINFSLQDLNLDYASFSAHKIGALKGTGLLYVKKSAPFLPLIFGGQQERRRRGGTENSLGQIACGVAAQEIEDSLVKMKKIECLRHRLESEVQERIDDVQVFGTENLRLPNTSLMTIKGVDGETLLMALDLKGFAVSTGAACASGNPEPSPTLLAMGYSRIQAQSSLRISLGCETSTAQVEAFVNFLVEVVARLREAGQSSAQPRDQRFGLELR